MTTALNDAASEATKGSALDGTVGADMAPYHEIARNAALDEWVLADWAELDLERSFWKDGSKAQASADGLQTCEALTCATKEGPNAP